MNISYNWLKEHVSKLPRPEKLAELLTMHSFEVERFEKMGNDWIFDIDVLPNRTHDCLSHIGVARECAALLKSKFPAFVKASAGKQILNSKTQALKVEVKDKKLCSRYIGRIITGIKVGSSPKWLKERLEVLGQKSINNIVDATNYTMFETGQPLHAFDADKVQGRKIIVRQAKNKEKITTLDNEKYELDKSILLIADSKDPLAIAGIKGGKKAEIDNNTKTIILESANFNPVNIRRTSRKIGLHTEASTRFENEISPELTEFAMDRLTALIAKLAKPAKLEIGSKTDIYSRRANPHSLGLSTKKVSNLLGVDIPEQKIINILKNLSFEVKKLNPLKNILKLAKSLEGAKYKYGASVTYDAPNYFDCSSFISYIYAHSGIQIPRMSVDQYFFGKPIEKKDLRPGDLVFSSSATGKIHYQSKEFIKGLKIKEGISHCGLYLGNNKVIHATANKGKVVIEKLNKIKNLRGFRRIITEKDNRLLITVPFWRLDIKKQEDLIEEIGRIYGYEKIQAKLPVGILGVSKPNDLLKLKNKVKNILEGLGLTEVYNYSFVGEDDLDKLALDVKKYLELENPLSLNLKYLRRDLILGLLKNTRDNFRFFEEIRLFELGKVYLKNEKMMLAGILERKTKGDERLFYEAKGIVDAFLNKLGITGQWYDDFKATPEWTEKKIWDSRRSAEIKLGDKEIGFVGEINSEILSQFGIKDQVAAFNFDFESLIKLISEELIYQSLSKYPSVVRDIAVLVNLKDRVVDVLNLINNIGGELVRDVDLFDMYEGKEIAGGKKNLAFHIIYQSDTRTLTDKEVDKIHNRIIKDLEKRSGWEVRK